MSDESYSKPSLIYLEKIEQKLQPPKINKKWHMNDQSYLKQSVIYSEKIEQNLQARKIKKNGK